MYTTKTCWVLTAFQLAIVAVLLYNIQYWRNSSKEWEALAWEGLALSKALNEEIKTIRLENDALISMYMTNPCEADTNVSFSNYSTSSVLRR